MNRLNEKIAALKKDGKKALVAFVTAGYPDIRSTADIVGVLAEHGADVIELGIPFSDPVADGPTIQASSQFALDRGVSLKDIMDAVVAIRKKTDVPLVFMSYLNPLLRGGFERTVKEAASRGVDGFIIPDLIPEEADGFARACRANGVSLVFLAAPNTPAERLAYIDGASDGFVYVVSLTGVTGSREFLSHDLRRFLAAARQRITRHPRFLGFGIAKPEHVLQVKDQVDGVIVGSALINIIRESSNAAERRKRLASFVRSLRNALDAPK